VRARWRSVRGCLKRAPSARRAAPVNAELRHLHALVPEHRDYRAGLWENWKDPKTEEWVRTCMIVTCEPNEQMSALHDRMPAILHPDEYGRWLGEAEAPQDELKDTAAVRRRSPDLAGIDADEQARACAGRAGGTRSGRSGGREEEIAAERTQPRTARGDTRGMRLALQHVYAAPVGDHCVAVLRTPGGRAIDLIFYDGSGVTRSVCVWRLAGCAVHYVVAGDA
jgi:hypothetical protein